MQTYDCEFDEQGEWRLLGPLHAQESGTFRTPDFDRSLLPDGGNVKGLRVQLQVPHRYWQMWYPGEGSKCFSWGDATKQTYAGSLQKDAFAAGIAWLHATHTKMVEAKPCVPKPLAPQLQIANASLAIGSPSTVVRPATLGDPTPLDQTLLASRLHPQPSTAQRKRGSYAISDYWGRNDGQIPYDGRTANAGGCQESGRTYAGVHECGGGCICEQILQRHGCGAGPSEALREQPVR